MPVKRPILQRAKLENSNDATTFWYPESQMSAANSKKMF